MTETDKTVADEYFIPIDGKEELPLPASYTEPLETLDSSELASFTLKPAKNRYLKPFLKLTGLILMLLVSWELFQFVSDLAHWHWSLGYIVICLLVFLLVLLLLAIRAYRRNQKELESVYRFQRKAHLFVEERTFGKTAGFIRDLEVLYADKPQEPLLKKAIKLLPDYNNDREVLHHLSQHFFSYLDKRALKVVSNYSQQTALLVALSPLAIADMLLSLWRMLKMVDEISQVYGLRPSIPGRIKLGSRLLAGMALAGASELAADAIADFSAFGTAGIVSARMGQGVGVGLYVARLGIRTMALCRPIPFEKDSRPGITDLRLTLDSILSEHLSKNAEAK